ncbi:M60 family metallopeptidase [Pedobacter endophyticus]|uniref:Discoidin domain-containing protein n=1 Tax=Pedobacter endophyticus TaxID=2789740 RepID=A0A7U3SPU0_9SPHI|nr:M60 family metallopeptidase [Pedobacter endophyticus]QPH38873.1 discoidin domain-containing protein [Pedobacter endophyticus]
MKLKIYLPFTAIAAIVLSLTACKKYGIEVPDGFDDASGNQTNVTVDTNMKNIDRSGYAKARIFPGLVDQSEPRVQNQEFTLDLNFANQTTDNLRISVAPKPRFSTGYYAAPGELIKIIVPAGANGLNMQIGGHTDNLSGKSPLLRDPIIYNIQPLYPGVNYMRNIYGGTIYINATIAIAQPVKFIISGAVVSPDFVLGVDNDVSWLAKVKASKVPWLELRCKRVVFLVPLDKIQAKVNAGQLNNPTALMTEWNNKFELDFNGWMGLSDNAAEIIDRSPQGAWRGVLDIQLSAGYGHNGFPFVGLNDAEWFNGMTSLSRLFTNDGMWGTYHEFGHNCQQTRVWSWSTLGETTNNLFNFKTANRVGADYTILHPGVTKGFPLAVAWASNSTIPKNFDGDKEIDDPFKRMTPFIQIFEKYGYEAMTKLYTEARRVQRLAINDIDKHDFVYEHLSAYTQSDLAAFFDAWGITISKQTNAKVAAKYPLLTKQIWTYNPLDKTGGTADIVPTIYSVSSNQSNEGSPANMLDGNTATYWHSQYSPAPSAEQSYPHTIVYGQNQRLPIKGLYFVPRNSTAQRVKDAEILVSDDNVNFTSVGTFRIPNAFARYDFNFPGGVVAPRFIKIVFKNSWVSGNTKLAAVAEIGVIKP